MEPATAAAFKELKRRFRFVSRQWLRSVAHLGVAVVVQIVNEETDVVPRTRGDETDDEEEKEARNNRPLTRKRARAGDAATPPKQLKVEQQSAQAGAVAAAAAQEDEEEPFVMQPIVDGEKCSGGCGLKPTVPRAFCHGTGGKQHILCANCLEWRYGEGLLRLTDEPALFTCPMRRCARRLESRELAAATRDHAPALYAHVMQAAREQRLPKPVEDTKQLQQSVQPVQHLSSTGPTLATHLLDRYLSQVGDQKENAGGVAVTLQQPLVWKCPTSAAAAAEEEEPEVTEEDEGQLREMAAIVDKDRLKQLQVHFPDTAIGWLVRHADYGMEALVEMVTSGNADVKMRERADGRGATAIVQATLRDRPQFECSVCFGDYDEHMAINCVSLQGGDERQDVEEGDRERRETHKFCPECIVGHARTAIEQNVIMPAGVGIKCMDLSCENTLLRATIDQVLDMKTRADIDPLFNNEALLAVGCEDIVKCQRCSNAVVMDDKQTQSIFRCDSCSHAHCRLCNRTYDVAHEGRTCEELDPESVRKRVEEELTEQAMHKCPRCKKFIEKSDGCNKITCPCGQFSCYVCKAAVDDYNHFKRGNGPDQKNKCALHSNPNTKRKKQRQAALRNQINQAADEEVKEQLRLLA